MKAISKRDKRLIFAAWVAGVLVTGTAWAQVTMIDNWWTGGAGTTNWTDAANWTNGVPDTNHFVRFGYEGPKTNVPDEAQNIYLSAPQVIGQIQFECDGNRAVTLSGSNLTVRAPEGERNPYSNIVMLETATADATVNLEWIFDCFTSPYFYQNSTNAALILGPAGTIDGVNTTWGYAGDFLNAYGDGVYRMEGRLVDAMRCYGARNWVLAPGEGVPWSLTTLNLSVPITLAVEKDAIMAGRVRSLGVGDDITIVRTTAGDRVITFARDYWGEGSCSMYLRHADDAGDGHLTVSLGGLQEFGPSVVTTNDTTVLFVPHGIGDDRHILWADNPGISGPGRMHVQESSSAYSLQVYRQLEHTGGTLVSTGMVQLLSYGVGTNGAMPDAGMLTVDADGVFDLNGIDDTIGGLGGDGEVRLGDATLTLSEGIAPGMSVGTTTVSEGGTLVVGGTSTFEINSTSDYDTVVIPDANLTLGGTLKVVVNGPFMDEYYTDYVIFTLTNGTPSGSFSDYEDNFIGHGTCEIVGKDVILTINRPTGTAITIE